MEISSMDLNRGWGLYGRGWNNFKRAPLTWVLTIIVFMVISLVLNLIPLLGSLALAVLTPALVAGLLKMAHDVERGETVGVGHLFLPLQDAQRRMPLLLLGVLALFAAIVMVVVMALFMGGAMTVTSVAGGEAGAFPMAGIGFFGLLVMFLLYLLIFAALAFAIPLVYFRGVPIEAGVMGSLRGTVANLGPLIIFSLIYLVLAFIAMIPFGLGLLILGPVVLAAMYGAYSEIFPEPQVLEGEVV
jgi:uncharacterized membrane protein